MDRRTICRYWKYYKRAKSTIQRASTLTPTTLSYLQNILKQGILTRDMFYDIALGAALGYSTPISLSKEFLEDSKPPKLTAGPVKVEQVLPAYRTTSYIIITWVIPVKLQGKQPSKQLTPSRVIVEELAPANEASYTITTWQKPIAVPRQSVNVANSYSITNCDKSVKPTKLLRACSHTHTNLKMYISPKYSRRRMCNRECLYPGHVERPDKVIELHRTCSQTNLDFYTLTKSSEIICYRPSKKLKRRDSVRMKEIVDIAVQCLKSAYGIKSTVNTQSSSKDADTQTDATTYSTCHGVKSENDVTICCGSPRESIKRNISDSDLSPATFYTSVDEFF